MILADKIIKQRKQKGWSQEEFAEMMGVSRQAVSKWESAQSIPEISKILLMSSLFGVTTDYLLKDGIEDFDCPLKDGIENSECADSETAACRRLTLEDANRYVSSSKKRSLVIAAATCLCVMSPIVLIVLGGLSSILDSFISEGVACAIGIGVLFVLVAIAVAMFIYSDFLGSDFKYLENEYFECEEGVGKMATDKLQKIRLRYMLSNIIASVMCVISPLPLIFCAFSGNEVICVYMIGVLLLVVAIAVFIFISVGNVWEAYQRILKNPKYAVPKNDNKKIRNIENIVTDIYWTLVLAVYLIWSFSCSAWAISWIVWPIAAPLSAIIPIIFRSKRR